VPPLPEPVASADSVKGLEGVAKDRLAEVIEMLPPLPRASCAADRSLVARMRTPFVAVILSALVETSCALEKS